MIRSDLQQSSALRRGTRSILSLFLALLVAIGLLGAGNTVQAQDAGNRAGIVVVAPDGRVTTRCVAFEEPAISGYALLQRSGLSFVTTSGPMGVTVCALNGEGCPATDCWCKCKTTPCGYWNYYHGAPGGSWSYATLGAAARTLNPGDVDAWMWGDGSGFPPAITFESICAAGGQPAAVPTATPDTAPAATAVPPSPTATVAPAPLPPTATPAATVAATSTPEPTAAPRVVASETPVSDSPTPSVTPTRTASPAPTDTDTPLPSATVDQPTVPPPASAGAEQEGGPAGGYLAFAVILGVLGGLFYIVRHRQGA